MSGRSLGSPRAEGVVTVSTLARQTDDLEQQLAALSTALNSAAERSAATVKALQLLDAAAQGLEVRCSCCVGVLRRGSTGTSTPRVDAGRPEHQADAWPPSPPLTACPPLPPCPQESAREAAARRDELLLSARRLALELRGLDLLAGHVKAVDALVRRLEGQAAEAVAGAARH